MFGGRRAPVMSLFCLATVPVLLVLWPGAGAGAREPGLGSGVGADGGGGGGGGGAAPPPVSLPHLLALFGALGATTFAPHVLTSLCAREMSDADVASTAMGVVKAVGQVGAALAGSPIAYVVTVHGWHAVAMALVACSVVSTVAYAAVR